MGLLGEMTLLRYFQRTDGIRPDVLTVAADSEADRLAAIAEVVADRSAVYITRPLPGAPERYSLAAVGPLAQVWPKGGAILAEPQHELLVPFTESVSLAGYSTELRSSHQASTSVRLSLHWLVSVPVNDDLKVSARLVDASGAVVSVTDQVPVHNTYPTWAWTPGETVADSYDLSLPPDSGAEPYRLLVILYRAADGSEVGRAELGQVSTS